MTQPCIPRPEARYGRAATVPRVAASGGIALGVLVVAAGIAVAFAGYQRLGTSDVSGSLAGYQVIDHETASVTISVTRSDPVAAGGLHRAGSREGRQRNGQTRGSGPAVGGGHGAGDHDGEILTAAGDGGLYGCGANVPSYLRAS